MSQNNLKATRTAKANSIARRLRSSGNSLSIIRVMILVIGVSLVPLVYAALLTWSNVDPINRLHQVPAAVVNLDKGNTDPDLDLGDELTDELLDSTSNNNLDWTEMSESRANKALQDGEVYAVLRIPENFSSNVASVGNDDPSTAVKAQLSITTNDAKNMISGNLAQSILTKVTDTLNEKVSDEYLHNIYAGFNDMHDSLSDAEDGAGQLADGSSDAKDGADKLADGTTNAKDGVGQLADGTATAKDGSGKLVVGLGDLKDGAVKLSNGATTLANGTTQLKDATGRAASGAGDLANGVGRLDSAASQLNDGATQVNDGALRLRVGLTDAQDGSAKIAAGLNELNSKTAILPDAVAELKKGSAALADGSELIAERLDDLDARGPEIVEDLHDLKNKTRGAHDEAVQLKQLTTEDVEGTEAYAESLADIQAHWDEMSPEQQKQTIDGLKDGADQIAERSRTINEGVSDLDLKIIVPLDLAAHAVDKKVDELPALLDRAAEKSREVADKFKRLDDGVRELDAKSTQLVDGINQLATGANSLNSGLGQLSDGAGELSNGTGRLADGTSQLKDGTGTAYAGASTLADGAKKLDAASGKLNDGAQRLATGTGDLSNGASKLKDGAIQLNGGLGKLNDGAVKLDDGIGQLDDGAHKLGGGLGELKDGANELHDGLADGVEQVPNYSSSEEDHLASVASQQVDLSKHRLHEVESYGYGLGPYFMTLSLWIGALAFFLVFPALSGRRVGSNMPAAMVALASYLPSAFVSVLQSVLMVSTVHFLVGIDMERLGQAFLISFLASLTFMALNQALVACFGPVGRFMSLIFTVLQLASAGATYPIETTPKFFQIISPYLPFTSVVNALRVAIAGGSINFAHVIWVMVAYSAVALVMLLFGIRAKRRVEKIKKKIHDRVESAAHEEAPAGEGAEGAEESDGSSDTEDAAQTDDAESAEDTEDTEESADAEEQQDAGEAAESETPESSEGSAPGEKA
ncbi:YhgE/Pip family protein [Dermabacter hominis]|uniref:YhgE/Pip family protein n=1 Tax=Dermabacter hominis TaxID=36740 RepID=UPI00242D2C53|nr:YhgE/Pip family protein [Dermabacter hominis]